LRVIIQHACLLVLALFVFPEASRSVFSSLVGEWSECGRMGEVQCRNAKGWQEGKGEWENEIEGITLIECSAEK